jgi:ABC-2 type transport system permease protein
VTAALFSLTLRTHGRRGRVLALLLAGLVAVVLVAAVRGGSSDVLEDSTLLIARYGFTLVVPVACLVIASAVFGDMIEDRTLVYVWLRPVPRWELVAGPYAATITIALPIVVLPLVFAAALSGEPDLVAGTLVAATVAVVAYSALFLALGLRTKRALLWGLAYIFIWEGVVASIGGLSAQLAIRSYANSILAEFTGVDIDLADDSLGVAIVVPLLAAALFTTYTTFRLRRMDVD